MWLKDILSKFVSWIDNPAAHILDPRLSEGTKAVFSHIDFPWPELKFDSIPSTTFWTVTKDDEQIPKHVAETLEQISPGELSYRIQI